MTFKFNCTRLHRQCRPEIRSSSISTRAAATLLNADGGPFLVAPLFMERGTITLPRHRGKSAAGAFGAGSARPGWLSARPVAGLSLISVSYPLGLGGGLPPIYE